MKKIILFLALCLIVPSLSFAAVALTDGSSIAGNGNPSNPVSLSPGVNLSYDANVATTGKYESYALTGANAKGVMSYAVFTGDQGVYQHTVSKGAANTETANDDTDYSTTTGWAQVGG